MSDDAKSDDETEDETETESVESHLPLLFPGTSITLDEETVTRSVSSVYGTELARKTLRYTEAEAGLAEYPDFRPNTASLILKDRPAEVAEIIGSDRTGGVLLRAGHTARLLADFKAGKTTILLEFLRCSLTGEPFLGALPTKPVAKDAKVAWVDPELSERDRYDYLEAALGDLPTSVTDRLIVVALKGLPPLDLLSVPHGIWLAEQLEGCERVAVDSVMDLFDGDPNDAHDVRTLFENWDQIKDAAGISEAIWAVHMNRAREERSFGSIKWDARFESMWTLILDREAADLGSSGTGIPRYFRADPGRGTGFPETKVELKVTTITSGSAGSEDSDALAGSVAASGGPSSGLGRPVIDLGALGLDRKRARQEDRVKKTMDKDETTKLALLAVAKIAAPSDGEGLTKSALTVRYKEYVVERGISTQVHSRTAEIYKVLNDLHTNGEIEDSGKSARSGAPLVRLGSKSVLAGMIDDPDLPEEDLPLPPVSTWESDEPGESKD